LGLNRKSVQKLASLSALGAGAIALTADKADASTIISQTGIDLKVGFDCGCTGYQSSTVVSLNLGALAGFAAMAFHTVPLYGAGPSTLNVQAFVLALGTAYHATPTASGTQLAAGQFQFKAVPNSFPGAHYFNAFIGLFNAGAVFSSGPAVSGPYPVAQQVFRYNTYLYTSATSATFPGPTTGYALFKFDDPACGSGTCYGWTQIAVSYGQYGPNIDILGWAYDTSGNQLPAGEVPEPSTLAMTGLAALALGAKGVRQWRRARAQKA
jgi:hypothetical protein